VNSQKNIKDSERLDNGGAELGDDICEM